MVLQKVYLRLSSPTIRTVRTNSRNLPGYNDIASWNHQLLLSAFGAEDGGRNSRRVYTKAEFEKAISTPEYVEPSSIQLLEVIVDKMDVPWRLQAQIDLINERNKANGK